MDWTKQAGTMAATYQDLLVPAMFEPCAELLLDAAGLEPGTRVLDVACGTGAVSRKAAARVGSGGLVVGVDMGEPMLEVARSLGSPEGGADIDYHQGEAGSLPVPDASFDVVTCQHGFQFFPDKPAALAEMRRVLVPGGRVAIACWTDSESAPTFQGIIDALDRHIGEEGSSLMRAPFAVSADELGRFLEEAGFEGVQARRETIQAAFAPRESLERDALNAGPVAPIFNAQTDEVQDAIVADAGAVMERFKRADGGVTAPMTTGIATGRSPQ